MGGAAVIGPGGAAVIGPGGAAVIGPGGSAVIGPGGAAGHGKKHCGIFVYRLDKACPIGYNDKHGSKGLPSNWRI
jgi:hypothetical protein